MARFQGAGCLCDPQAVRRVGPLLFADLAALRAGACALPAACAGCDCASFAAVVGGGAAADAGAPAGCDALGWSRYVTPGSCAAPDAFYACEAAGGGANHSSPCAEAGARACTAAEAGSLAALFGAPCGGAAPPCCADALPAPALIESYDNATVNASFAEPPVLPADPVGNPFANPVADVAVVPNGTAGAIEAVTEGPPPDFPPPFLDPAAIPAANATAGGFNDTDVAVPTEYADMAALLGSYDSLSLFEGIYESLGVDAIASNAYTKTIFVPTDEAIEIFFGMFNRTVVRDAAQIPGLMTIVMNHVVYQDLDVADIQAATDVPNMLGLPLSVDASSVEGFKIVSPKLKAGDVSVYVIQGFLIPAGYYSSSLVQTGATSSQLNLDAFMDFVAGGTDETEYGLRRRRAR